MKHQVLGVLPLLSVTAVALTLSACGGSNQATALAPESPAPTASSRKQAPTSPAGKPAVSSTPESKQQAENDPRMKCGTADECYTQAMAAKKAGEMTKAMRLVSNACALGSMDGCLVRAMSLHEDQAEEALSLFSRVCLKGKTPHNPAGVSIACTEAGNRLYESKPARASRFFERGCNEPIHVDQACKAVAVLAHDAGRYAKAKHYAERACTGSIIDGCNVLGVMFTRGEGVKQDIGKAMALFDKACRGGDKEACNNETKLGQAIQKAKNQSQSPSDVPGANVTMGDMTVNGVHVKDIACRMASSGMLGAMVGPSLIIGKLAKKKNALAACTQRKSTRIHFLMTGGRLSPKPSQGVPANTQRCLDRVLRTVTAKAKGECAMTLTY